MADLYDAGADGQTSEYYYNAGFDSYKRLGTDAYLFVEPREYDQNIIYVSSLGFDKDRNFVKSTKGVALDVAAKPDLAALYPNANGYYALVTSGKQLQILQIDGFGG